MFPYAGDNGTIGQQLEKLKENILEVLNRCGEVTRNILTAGQTAEESLGDISSAEEAISRCVLEGVGGRIVCEKS